MATPSIHAPVATVPAAPVTVAAPVRADALETTRSNGTALPSRAESNAHTREVIKTFFAPYDDPIRQDLACIAEVVAARKADPKTFADGENPYKIHYAVYNLRNPDVVKALVDAHKSGVDVQVLIEQAQLDEKKPWNTTDEELRANGFEFSVTHKGLNAAQKKELDLIGIEGAGLMHLKTRLFSMPDAQTGQPVEKLLTGSMNPGDEVAGNQETLHLIQDPVLIERYKAKYDAVLNGARLPNTWKEGAAVNVLFTPAVDGPQPADKILELMDQEKEAIFMSVFSLRDIESPSQQESMLQKLKLAHERGVQVVIVTDRKQSDGVDANGAKMTYDDKTEDKVRALGIPVFECTNEYGPFNAMHNKSAVFGLSNMKVVTDCGNWTAAALGNKKTKAKNEESFLFVDSGKLDGNATGMRYLSNFLYLLRTYDHQQTEGPKAAELLGKLQAHPSWPKVKVDFNVMAKTCFGQEVYITGNHEALGSWQKSGPGLKMNTTGGTYPLWNADTSIELPFGTSLEFKVVKRDMATGALQWEPEGNHLLLVDNADLRTPGADLRGKRVGVTTKFRE